ncbi:hypothetical protein DPEC_G00220560 [Dallia pectoralis]|uniref:Uncharacterized protein n=1 Tax=Dallia pectoralis TaxID=75939 RepID=A0ACC2G3T2_DALPE|nr:hypothetical protein DPEC_G00220560 [Dallia pectoralis]
MSLGFPSHWERIATTLNSYRSTLTMKDLYLGDVTETLPVNLLFRSKHVIPGNRGLAEALSISNNMSGVVMELKSWLSLIDLHNWPRSHCIHLQLLYLQALCRDAVPQEGDSGLEEGTFLTLDV